MEYYCQKNYVILMTDGISTMDRNDVLKTINPETKEVRDRDIERAHRNG